MASQSGEATAPEYEAVQDGQGDAWDVEHGERSPLLEDSQESSRDKKKKKKKKKDEKIMSSDLGTAMQSERTYFKWVWLGFHMGAINTFILAFFGKSEHVFAKLGLVALIWGIALAFVLYGVISYYRRRRALQLGESDRFFWDNPWGPYAVAVAVTFEVLTVLIFAIVDTR
eukprot:Plantae.Rhodophyta-Purpureofilum_apyrenoidigerum.ctg2487.p1 GENE.Plantae.Rhodophyta-Purpureofilum_apyrenoidigerum.ctg2487~~Plantae.Rhodophyta-Purpureofilum_apyrenoidigerum.ctg2487.p1  ORF type:complete len:171 (-),score=35.50 Plantae.Rhodophyta-Purpureofilum_apyrenoidigerum.ctg2487:421-933(-)